MRVGLVTDFYYPWIGGPSIVVRNLAHGLAQRGHEVFLLAPGTSYHPEYGEEGPASVTRVRTVPSPFGYRLRVAPWPRPEVSRWLRRVRPDVVHVHHPFPLSATAVLAARRRGIPVAATNHTIPECSLWGIRATGGLYDLVSTAFGWWIVSLLQRCAAVATPSAFAASALTELGYRGDVQVISNGVDTDRFRPAPPAGDLRTRLGLDDRPVVLYTGRLDPDKQMDVWLRAGAEVARRASAQLVVGGNGTDRVRLERLAAELGMGSSVRLPGYLSDADFAGLYRLADVYFITSPVELQSLTTLEAIASGLPVVAVQAGALPELVAHGKNGYLVRPGDWSAAADLICELLGDSRLRHDLGSRSRELALSHGLDASIDKYDAFLRAAPLVTPGEPLGGRVPLSGS